MDSQKYGKISSNSEIASPLNEKKIQLEAQGKLSPARNENEFFQTSIPNLSMGETLHVIKIRESSPDAKNSQENCFPFYETTESSTKSEAMYLRKRKVPVQSSKKEITKQLPVSSSQIDKMFSKYRKIRDNPNLCGPSCECYYCSLLNYSSDGNTDDEPDTVAVAYGFQRKSVKKRKNPKIGKRAKRFIKRRSQHYYESSHWSESGDSSSGGSGDQLPETVSQKFCRKSPKNKPLVDKVPNFVKDFRKTMSETRNESMGDSVFDTILACFDNLWLKILDFLDFLFCHDTKRVSPELPVFFTNSNKAWETEADDIAFDNQFAPLNSVKVIRNK